MQVVDDGVGMPADVDLRDTDTLGLQIVLALCEHQLGGRLNLDRTNGTRFLIQFKDTPQKGFTQI